MIFAVVKLIIRAFADGYGWMIRDIHVVMTEDGLSMFIRYRVKVDKSSWCRWFPDVFAQDFPNTLYQSIE